MSHLKPVSSQHEARCKPGLGMVGHEGQVDHQPQTTTSMASILRRTGITSLCIGAFAVKPFSPSMTDSPRIAAYSHSRRRPVLAIVKARGNGYNRFGLHLSFPFTGNTSPRSRPSGGGMTFKRNAGSRFLGLLRGTNHQTVRLT